MVPFLETPGGFGFGLAIAMMAVSLCALPDLYKRWSHRREKRKA